MSTGTGHAAGAGAAGGALVPTNVTLPRFSVDQLAAVFSDNLWDLQDTKLNQWKPGVKTGNGDVDTIQHAIKVLASTIGKFLDASSASKPGELAQERKARVTILGSLMRLAACLCQTLMTHQVAIFGVNHAASAGKVNTTESCLTAILVRLLYLTEDCEDAWVNELANFTPSTREIAYAVATLLSLLQHFQRVLTRVHITDTFVTYFERQTQLLQTLHDCVMRCYAVTPRIIDGNLMEPDDLNESAKKMALFVYNAMFKRGFPDVCRANAILMVRAEWTEHPGFSRVLPIPDIYFVFDPLIILNKLDLLLRYFAWVLTSSVQQAIVDAQAAGKDVRKAGEICGIEPWKLKDIFEELSRWTVVCAVPGLLRLKDAKSSALKMIDVGILVPMLEKMWPDNSNTDNSEFSGLAAFEANACALCTKEFTTQVRSRILKQTIRPEWGVTVQDFVLHNCIANWPTTAFSETDAMTVKQLPMPPQFSEETLSNAIKILVDALRGIIEGQAYVADATDEARSKARQEDDALLRRYNGAAEAAGGAAPMNTTP